MRLMDCFVVYLKNKKKIYRFWNWVIQSGMVQVFLYLFLIGFQLDWHLELNEVEKRINQKFKCE